ESTKEMYKAVKKRFSQSDILVMAAAPADFATKNRAKNKIKKGSNITLELTPTIDILKLLKDVKRKGQKVIGFALETENGLENAMAKLKAKYLDIIVLNSTDVGLPFDGDSDKVTLIYRNGQKEPLALMNKRELAQLLVEKIAGIK
ncbi:MAG: phosphopantothenoylcysteine decarboxylase, partial [candidate division Zixibacteria bacterium]|nr:phosphopantothenoylcysteine decarboxylase [candidate division Zixibacteria bacterium]